MIQTEQFECLIPTPNAIKEGVLYCTGTAPDNYLVLGDVATWITAIATSLLVIGAGWAGKIALDTLRHMKADSLARTRPYLYASLTPSLAGGAKYDVLIRNMGESIANHVQISFEGFTEEPDNVAQMLIDTQEIRHTLPPRTSLRRYWRLELAKGHTWSDGTDKPAGMPKSGAVFLKYVDGEGRRYEDRFVLDTASVAGSPMPEDGPNVKEKLSDEQKDQHKMLAVIARAIGELRR